MTSCWYRSVVIAMSIAALAGCASTSGDADLASMRAALEQATADAAEAKRMAAAAKLTAEQARAEAADANSRSVSTESKIDRMFKKAMYK